MESAVEYIQTKGWAYKEKAGQLILAACPFCQVQFDTIQAKIAMDRNRTYDLPSILYPQLLGLAMGLDRNSLGIDENRLSLDKIEAYL